MKFVVFVLIFDLSISVSDSFSNEQKLAPISADSNNFEDAHNSAKKKNVWKKTVGKNVTQKNMFNTYKDKIITFAKRHYNSYMKDMSIEKIIATQIAAVVIFTLFSSLTKALFGKKKQKVETSEDVDEDIVEEKTVDEDTADESETEPVADITDEIEETPDAESEISNNDKSEENDDNNEES